MNGSGKAGSGRGNNRRPFRRRNNDAQQERSRDGWQSVREDEISDRNEYHQKSRASAPEKKSGGRFPENQNRGGAPRKTGDGFRGEKPAFIERPRWIPPKPNTEPLPVPNCPWCGKPIRDIFTALTDRDTGVPVHFDCVIERIAGGEKLEKGEVVSYIGGGRFGIVNFGASRFSREDAPQESRNLKIIRKIIEWENTDKRAEWRSEISDHYSVT